MLAYVFLFCFFFLFAWSICYVSAKIFQYPDSTQLCTFLYPYLFLLEHAGREGGANDGVELPAFCDPYERG